MLRMLSVPSKYIAPPTMEPVDVAWFLSKVDSLMFMLALLEYIAPP